MNSYCSRWNNTRHQLKPLQHVARDWYIFSAIFSRLFFYSPLPARSFIVIIINPVYLSHFFFYPARKWVTVTVKQSMLLSPCATFEERRGKKYYVTIICLLFLNKENGNALSNIDEWTELEWGRNDFVFFFGGWGNSLSVVSSLYWQIKRNWKGPFYFFRCMWCMGFIRMYCCP